ncbi:MAG TPA: hypothetical protein VNI01_03130 [Elusimicrobiota bacterium]|jgi:hypothetical protein|nr:hypothetical protein [Elusimicrobiota bacterium]
MNRMQMLTVVLGLGAFAPSLRAADVPPPADADDKGRMEDESKPPERTENKGTSREVSRIASEFKVTDQQVLDLRKQGLGWGEVRHALAISQKAGVPVGDVMKLRQSGMGWGKIAQNYGFKLGDVSGKGRERVDRDDKRGDRDDKRGDRDAVADRNRDRDGDHDRSDRMMDHDRPHGGRGR